MCIRDRDKIVEAVKLGVSMAGGTPIVFPAIAVCDGIAMGHIGMKYSLVTRDLIADSTEAMAMAHAFDALVMVPNCDKNVPGLLMAAARVNIPTVFVSGGPMLAGHVKGQKRLSLIHIWRRRYYKRRRTVKSAGICFRAFGTLQGKSYTYCNRNKRICRKRKSEESSGIYGFISV